jgi:hypothetical protein
MTLIEAYQRLGQCALANLYPFRGLEHVKCASNLPGRKPWLIRRRDVERMVLVMRETGLSAAAAARVVAAENEGRI